MDVGDQRNVALLLDATEGFGGIHVRHADTHDIGTGILEALDLRDGGGDIVGVGVGHALHGNRCIAADGHIADMNLARDAALDGGVTMHGIPDHSPRVSLATLPRVTRVRSTASFM